MIGKEEHCPGTLVSFTWEENRLICKSDNGVVLMLEVYSDEIIRIRYATSGFFYPDFSYAIDENFKKTSSQITFKDHLDYIVIKTSCLQVRVCKVGLLCTFLDLNDYVINKDEKGFHWEKSEDTGNDIVQMSKHVYPSEVYFGLGDKPSELNLKGRKFETWGTDSYGYDYGRDPLYKNIPFYYGLHGGVGYGIFFDNSHRTFFDFASERNSASSFWSHGGEMNYYFIAGPQLLDVNMRYAKLTGTHDMPAMWALGFQQCKWSYQPESQVKEVTSLMREYKIPCDAIYLDIDYMDGFRCFTWDMEKFPNPKKMVAELDEKGFKTVVIIDPGLKIDPSYEIYKEGFEKGYFLRRLDGPYAMGKVWPGDCYFPDFTNPEVRSWWADLYSELIGEIGVAGVWNDMNEPAIFEVDSKTMPDDVMFDYEGHPASHRKGHNVYGSQMVRATYEGVKKHGDNKRGLIITRSGYAGLQRYSSVWTGDNISTWQHVWLANVQCQRLAISGVSFSGSDIGGFIGKPTPEMFLRWIQLAIWHPFCRVHSSQDDGAQEPWSFGEEVRELFRAAVELRYQLLPYHYTAFYRHHSTGRPILVPLSFYNQLDTETHYRDHEFLCGDHILTASIDKELTTSKKMYVPTGEWYDYWTNGCIRGGREIELPIEKSTFPFLIKAGAIIPFYPVQQYVDEVEIKEVTLKVYYKLGQEVSYLYEDAHNGYEYEQGDYRYSTFEYNGTADSLTITQSIEGSFQPTWPQLKIVLIGIMDESREVSVDGKAVEGEDIVIHADFESLLVRW